MNLGAAMRGEDSRQGQMFSYVSLESRVPQTHPLRALRVTLPVAQFTRRRGGSAIDARTTRHPGYGLSRVIRKRIEEAFGWGKTVGPIRKAKFRGLARVAFQFTLTMAGYNIIRLRNLGAMTQ